jgi:hypothetical protein
LSAFRVQKREVRDDDNQAAVNLRGAKHVASRAEHYARTNNDILIVFVQFADGGSPTPS